jgi:hypothetical protein
LRLRSEHLALGIGQMNMTVGCGLMNLAQDVNTVGKQGRVGLAYDRVAQRYEGVRLVVVLELARGDVNRAAMRLEKNGRNALCARRCRRRGRARNGC